MLGTIIILGAGCAKNNPPTNVVKNPVPSDVDKTTITYLVSNEDTTKYCNGADMDSAGYRKTITNEITTTTPKIDDSAIALARATLSLATTGMCANVWQGLTMASGTAFIPPIDGWAGVSITMCSCKPQIEVNLLRMPGIQKVVWQ